MEVQDDLLRAKDVGEELYKAFKEQRLECDPLKVKFYDTKKKAKLKIFTGLNNKIKVKASNNQEVVLKAEKRLFAQLDCDCQVQKLADERVPRPSARTTSMETG